MQTCLVRRHLTDEEREIRSGRGIPFGRWWPIAVLVIGASVAAGDYPALERCIGKPISVSGSHGGGVIHAVLAYFCTPIFLRGSWTDRIIVTAMWVPIPFAVLNWFWMKRHKAYWDRIRQREKERRAEKRAARSIKD